MTKPCYLPVPTASVAIAATNAAGASCGRLCPAPSTMQRDGRRSIPNDLGLQLARNGLAIRLAEAQATAAADLSVSGVTGALRLGAPPIVAGRFLTDALSEFIRTNPSCTVELRTGLVHELRSMLERGQIDLVLGPRSLADPNNCLAFGHLIDDQVGILCRKEHSLTRVKAIKKSDLAAQTWLAHSSGSLLRQQTEAAMIALGLADIQIGLESDSIRTVLEVVARTDLITTMPRATTAPYLEENLTFLKFDHPQFQRPLGAVRRIDTPVPKIEQRFLRLLRN